MDNIISSGYISGELLQQNRIHALLERYHSSKDKKDVLQCVRGLILEISPFLSKKNWDDLIEKRNLLNSMSMHYLEGIKHKAVEFLNLTDDILNIVMKTAYEEKLLRGRNEDE